MMRTIKLMRRIRMMLMMMVMIMTINYDGMYAHTYTWFDK